MNDYKIKADDGNVLMRISVKPVKNKIMETFSPDQELKALSWKQPYAELMLHGKIETRTWDTKYRGWVLICASQKEYKPMEVVALSGHEIRSTIMNVLYAANVHYHLNKGFAIAIGYLADSRPMKPEDEQACFIKYQSDRFCHVYENIRRIKPFFWKGKQGWRTVAEPIKEKLEFL